MDTLILLHGAIGSSTQLQTLANAFAPTYNIHNLNFDGHGGEPATGEPFSIKLFADNVFAYMKRHNIEKASFFGYSMGGYVAMYLARHHPEKVNKVVTLATKYHWDEATAAREIQMLQPEKIAMKLPAFAETLRIRHAPNDWRELLEKTAEMINTMGKQNPLAYEDYSCIEAPCLLLLGDRDKMVTLDETLATYRWLPNAQLGILPGMPHAIEQIDMDVLSPILKAFWRK